MKIITKIPLLVVATTMLSINAVNADDQHLQYRLARERADREARGDSMTTVAVYTHGRGVGYRTVSSDSAESQFEIRQNAHGEQFIVAAPVR
jgi:hypothetical protein